jgi:hypothetical protein
MNEDREHRRSAKKPYPDEQEELVSWTPHPLRTLPRLY